MYKLLLAAALLGSTSLSIAQQNTTMGLDLGVHVGTTGVGVDLSLPITETLKLRGGYNTFEFDMDLEDTEVNYEAQLDMTATSLVFDWHPFKSGFRFTAGARSFSSNNIGGSAVPSASQTFTLNNVVYNAADLAQLDVDVQFEEDVVPYYGIGWGNPSNGDRFTFTLDLGAVNVGTPEVNMLATCINVLVCTTINADVAAEQQQLRDDLEDFEWWPVVSLGFSYRF